MNSNKITKDMFMVLTYEIHDDQSKIIEKVDNPVTCIHGQGKKLLPKIEKALEGLTIGDHIEIMIGPEDGFGEYDESLIIKDKTSNVPKQFRKVDEIIAFVNEAGNKKDFRVIKVDDQNIVLDGNHYLSGKNLLYKIKILDVRESTPYDREQDKLSLINS